MRPRLSRQDQPRAQSGRIAQASASRAYRITSETAD